ncbi:MAG: hypothetical protein RL885_01925 [Planctomycetota bacterium]
MSLARSCSVGRVAAMVLLVLICCVGAVGAATGSYRFGIKSGQTSYPSGAQIRVTAQAKDAAGNSVATYDQTFSVGGLSPQVVRDTVLADLASKGWVVQSSSTDGIIITGWLSGGTTHEIAQVDIGANKKEVEPHCGGNVTATDAEPGDKKVKFELSGAQPDNANPGKAKGKLNSHTFEIPLLGSMSLADIAEALRAALAAQGFYVQRFGTQVHVPWLHPVNAALLGTDVVDIDFFLEDADGGPHLAVLFPSVQPAVAVPAASTWGLIGLVAMFGAAGFFVLRRVA